MHSDWIVLSDGFGCQFQSQVLRWIYWSPGKQAREGLLCWGKETNGVVPWSVDQPKHYFRPTKLIISDLLSNDIICVLKNEL